MKKTTKLESSGAWFDVSQLETMDMGCILSVTGALTKRLIGDSGRDGLLTCLSELTGCVVVIEDSEVFTLKVYGGGVDSNKYAPYLSVRSCGVIKEPKLLIDNPCRIFAAEDKHAEIRLCRLVTAVPDGHGRFVFLSLLSSGDMPDAKAAAALSIATDFLSIQTTLDEKVAGIELKLRGNFLEDLLSHSYLDRESILSRAKALDYDITQPHRVLVGTLDTASNNVSRYERDAKRYRAELVKLAQTGLDRNEGGMAVFKSGELLILHRQIETDDEAEASKRLAYDITNDITRALGLTVFVGIGSVCKTLEEYRESYQAAKKALEIGNYMITEGQVRSFEQFKVHALFLSTLNPDELVKYAKEQLGGLLEFDALRNTSLVITLQEFLYLRNNIEGTAKSINMSVSGLKYRLKKIEQIIGKDLRDNKVSFDLQLALIIFQLFGEYKIKNA